MNVFSFSQYLKLALISGSRRQQPWPMYISRGACIKALPRKKSNFCFLVIMIADVQFFSLIMVVCENQSKSMSY
jgi:hypothetical protein